MISALRTVEVTGEDGEAVTDEHGEVITVRITDAVKAVAGALGDMAGTSGHCWCWHHTLADKVGRSYDTVRRGIRILKQTGWLVVKPGGGRECSRYWLRWADTGELVGDGEIEERTYRKPKRSSRSSQPSSLSSQRAARPKPKPVEHRNVHPEVARRAGL